MKEKVMDIARRLARFDSSELDELASVLLHKCKISATFYNVGTYVPIARAASEEECELRLLDCGHSKLMVVKTIKEIFGLGLREAKQMADSVPCTLRDSTSVREAEELEAKFEEIGARTEIRYK
jgi:large subunit ribosomal protein L7/L12